MNSEQMRVEHDSMGEVPVPAHAKWRAQTQRAVRELPDLRRAAWSARRSPRSPGSRPPPPMANGALGVLDAELAEAIGAAAEEVADGRCDEQFPIDVFQTGSGTSSQHERQRGHRHARRRAVSAGRCTRTTT